MYKNPDITRRVIRKNIGNLVLDYRILAIYSQLLILFVFLLYQDNKEKEKTLDPK